MKIKLRAGLGWVAWTQFAIMTAAALTLTVLDIGPLLQWVLWGLLFFAFEIPGAYRILKDGGNGTLSHFVWRFMGVGQYKGTLTPSLRARRIAFGAFWFWLTAHFFFGWA